MEVDTVGIRKSPTGQQTFLWAASPRCFVLLSYLIKALMMDCDKIGCLIFRLSGVKLRPVHNA